MGRVLAGASLAALLLTAMATVHASVLEMRRGADIARLMEQKMRLVRIHTKLVELESSALRLVTVSRRAARLGLALRVPGLPDERVRGPGAGPAGSARP